ncbi:hypothetical protein K466DRAFT_587404 [Polyporus arcularius HHB13444]|uniref:Zn(2)-C6 fungal-type domain-containing protein n=1 Tax=Polyporus arcularius HHB13444 TaxID=1314778 RepID=A0A5C3PBC2_9APHY|nr:hypothetical protein K466DRAFT_587404 [Polyporus arcularius HHB13444]
MASFATDPAHADTSLGSDAVSADSAHHQNGLNSTDHLGNSTSGEHDTDNDAPGKKKKGTKRRKVNHACLYCRRSHMTCDEGRPCQRCIKREIGHLCHDERRTTAKEKASTPTPSSSITNPPVDVARGIPAGQYPSTAMPMTSTWPGMGLGMAQGAWMYPPETLSNEFSVLSDFLESLDDGTFFSQPPAVPPSLMSSPTYTNPVSLGVDNPYITQPQGIAGAAPTNTGPQVQPPTSPDRERDRPAEEPAPVVLPAATKTERFFLTAADQASGSRNERLNMVIRSKYEAGLLKPYNYVKGYARLSRWMDRNVSQESKQKILQPLSVLRPKFRAIAQSESLTDIDLVFIEEAFERLLLDYDRVFSAMAIPACLWRRTGEIYKANREFAELVGVDGYMLRDGRLCIYELMAEDSAVNYWEKYGNVAFDSNQKAVLTSCVLRYKPLLPSSGAVTPARVKEQQQQQPNEEGFMSCCFSFTIRRDPYGIPTLIVGNFIKC